MLSVTIKGVFFALIVFGAVKQATANEEDIARETKDRAAIQSLMWRYLRALDTMDIDTYLSLFTDDGRIVSGDNAIVGREALKRLMLNIAEGNEKRKAAGESVPASYHFLSNETIEFSGTDQAQLLAYWMAISDGAGPDDPPKIESVGWERNDLVRVDGEWLIKQRNTAPKD